MVASSPAATVPGQTISIQVSTDWVQVYYGPDLVISTNHGLSNMLSTYANGAFPNYEFQNHWTTTASVVAGGITCQRKPAFGPP